MIQEENTSEDSLKELSKLNSLKQNVIDALRCVYDPEITTINILDLGLIYELDVHKDGTVNIEHTLTSMNCPFADEICMSIENAVRGVVGVTKVNRKLVFVPPFSLDMVPEETKMLMGWI